MPSFTELSAKLDTQLKDVASKKIRMDELSKSLSTIANEYNAAVELAKQTRNELDNALNDALGRELKSKIG